MYTHESAIYAKRTRLHNFDVYKNHDKIYEVDLRKNLSNGGWEVLFRYGRRGTKLKDGCKNETKTGYRKMSYATALFTYDELVNKKKREGYDDITKMNDHTELINDVAKDALEFLLISKVIDEDTFNRYTDMLKSEDPESREFARNVICAKQLQMEKKAA